MPGSLQERLEPDPVQIRYVYSDQHLERPRRGPKAKLETAICPSQLDRAAGTPKLLVCHDLAGGYTEGELEAGGSLDVNDYFISHAWHAIDTFIYFSHRFVTIPPRGWISAAHLHHTKVSSNLEARKAYSSSSI